MQSPKKFESTNPAVSVFPVDLANSRSLKLDLGIPKIVSLILQTKAPIIFYQKSEASRWSVI